MIWTLMTERCPIHQKGVYQPFCNFGAHLNPWAGRCAVANGVEPPPTVPPPQVAVGGVATGAPLAGAQRPSAGRGAFPEKGWKWRAEFSFLLRSYTQQR